MTQLELQNQINNNKVLTLPSISAFGINPDSIILAAYGLKGTVKWTIENGKLSTIRGIRTEANCIEAHPNAGESKVFVEDEAGTQLTFDLSYVKEE